MIFFFESTCYPLIFAIATADLGSYNKLGSGLIAAGVSGGAVWPAMTGAVADNVNTHTAFFIPLIGFVPLCLYGLGMWYTRSMRYNGKLTVWASEPPLAVETAEEAMGPVMTNEKEEKEHIER